LGASWTTNLKFYDRPVPASSCGYVGYSRTTRVRHCPVRAQTIGQLTQRTDRLE
jgi:hypothetical protein